MSEDDSVKHEGKWTREDLPEPSRLSRLKHEIVKDFFWEDILDEVAAHLNAHYLPKPGIDNGPTAIESTLARERDEAIGRASYAEYALHKERKAVWIAKHLLTTLEARCNDAERERDAAAERAEKAERPPYDQGGVRGADSLLYRAERAERERDAAAARAEQAGARVRLANQQSVEWEGEAERLLCERDAWKARAEAAEARTAPAVTRDDIEKAIRYEFLDWEGQMEARISRAVNQTWNLVSGADPAVHVVRESDLPAARVDGDYYVVASAKGDYRWPQHGPSWWAGRAQDALAEAARYTSLARLAASEAVVDPVEAKARELYQAATPDARWETVADEYRRIARHVLGPEADGE